MPRQHFLSHVVALALVSTGCALDAAGPETETSTDPAEQVATATAALSGGQQGYAGVASNGTLVRSFATSGTVSSARTATGRYAVAITGMGGGGGNAQVVASGATNVRCKVSSWAPSGENIVVNVRCHNPAGALTDAGFNAHFGRAPGNGAAGAYLWADQPDVALNTEYFPSASFSWNSTTGPNAVIRTGEGLYTASLSGLGAFSGSVEVTAYGTTADYCKVVSWSPSMVAQDVRIACFNTSGDPTNTRFSLNYFTHGSVSMFDRGAYAFANSPSTTSYTPPASYSFNGLRAMCQTGTISAARISVGFYSLVFDTDSIPPDFLKGVMVFVTAYGSGSTYCKHSRDWNFSPSISHEVLCFTAGGAPIDSRYVLTTATKFLRAAC